MDDESVLELSVLCQIINQPTNNINNMFKIWQLKFDSAYVQRDWEDYN